MSGVGCLESVVKIQLTVGVSGGLLGKGSEDLAHTGCPAFSGKSDARNWLVVGVWGWLLGKWCEDLVYCRYLGLFG